MTIFIVILKIIGLIKYQRITIFLDIFSVCPKMINRHGTKIVPFWYSDNMVLVGRSDPRYDYSIYE